MMGLTYPLNKICPQCGTGGYVWYLNNSEYVAKCTNCGHYFRKEDFPIYVLDEAPKPTTNADRIRSMNDEELAEMFTCRNMFCCPVTGATCHKEPSCKDCFERWLKKEAK